LGIAVIITWVPDRYMLFIPFGASDIEKIPPVREIVLLVTIGPFIVNG
jgi:hypothetical protein